MNAIETHDLTKYYGSVRGIDCVSLSVDEGAFFGFIGPNGAGTSTLIRTLLGLISSTSGSAEIFGDHSKGLFPFHGIQNVAECRAIGTKVLVAVAKVDL